MKLWIIHVVAFFLAFFCLWLAYSQSVNIAHFLVHQVSLSAQDAAHGSGEASTPASTASQLGEWPVQERTHVEVCRALRELAERPRWPESYREADYIHKDIAATTACAQLDPVPVQEPITINLQDRAVTCPSTP